MAQSVTSIGKYAFYRCENLTDVSLSSALTTIGMSAFYMCRKLKSVDLLHTGLKAMNSYAFAYSGLESIVLPAGVEVGFGAFWACESLVWLEIKEGAESTVADSACMGCSAMYYAILSDSVKSIGNNAFGYITVSEKKSGFQVQAPTNSAGYIYAKDNEFTFVSTGTGTPNLPVITGQPQSLTVNVDEDTYFRVEAAGQSLHYQWQYKLAGTSAWKNFPEEGTRALKVTGAASNNGCQYRCVVSNALGSVTSSTVTLTVNGLGEKPKITSQPKDATVAKGSTVTFKVTASGTGLKYQWQFRKAGTSTWYNWDGKTNASLPVTGSDTNDQCQYRCVVSNAAGHVNSAAATLTVTGTTAAKPTITTQPKSVTVALGASATFKVVASGTGLKYQWQYKKADESTWHSWSGKTSATLTVTGSATNNGCLYRCVVKNSAGSVTSSQVKLTVN